MESQQSEKDFIKLLPETSTIDKQLHKIRKLEEPQIKDQYTCTVNKVGGTLKTENNVFTFDLYDNNFTKNMEPSFTFSFIYFLIKNFTQDLELIQATLEGNALTDAMNKLESYINEIVQIVAGNDTYQTLSKKHWVEKMDIKYHDTKVYDYFKTTFPELFD